MRLCRAHRRRLVSGGAFTLPVIAVLLTVNLLTGAGPLSVSGASATSDSAANGLQRPTIAAAPAVLAAQGRLADLAASEFGASPFFDPSSFERDPQVAVAKPEDPIGVTVQLVMRTGRGNIAMLDGETYREGDTVQGAAWMVHTIDIEQRSVMFTHPDGREVTLTVDRD